jgi:hypothetical protein
MYLEDQALSGTKVTDNHFPWEKEIMGGNREIVREENEEPFEQHNPSWFHSKSRNTSMDTP